MNASAASRWLWEEVVGGKKKKQEENSRFGFVSIRCCHEKREGDMEGDMRMKTHFWIVPWSIKMDWVTWIQDPCFMFLPALTSAADPEKQLLYMPTNSFLTGSLSSLWYSCSSTRAHTTSNTFIKPLSWIGLPAYAHTIHVLPLVVIVLTTAANTCSKSYVPGQWKII